MLALSFFCIYPSPLVYMKVDNSIAFFEKIKAMTEKAWEEIDPADEYGPRIPPGAKWNRGLTEEELKQFEQDMGFEFPLPLRNFYRTMNGLDKVDTWVDEHNVHHYFTPFYAYPRDLDRIYSMISWIYESTGVNSEIVKASGISRIFPVWQHRFIMIDNPGHPILSMHGSDIIFYGATLARNFIADHFDHRFGNDVRLKFPPIRGYSWKGWVVPFWYPGPRYRRRMLPRTTPYKGVLTKRFGKIKRKIIMDKLAMGRTKV
ncbi:SMI1/KNR4 family protein [Chitinophaga silvisoli]|uniref:SMI1/KNR4 family protein n=1 Tax=Chitinophaga silvisoli TaxID=2291814 RepID=A0A3E1NY07_9BACT|nr:SMI1/KNR4 family protein [Chitinophaga silvisoli]RFM32792.1 SMI1/KNR4 family protein [Chitinophaga silvisoli]